MKMSSTEKNLRLQVEKIEREIKIKESQTDRRKEMKIGSEMKGAKDRKGISRIQTKICKIAEPNSQKQVHIRLHQKERKRQIQKESQTKKHRWRKPDAEM